MPVSADATAKLHAGRRIDGFGNVEYPHPLAAFGQSRDEMAADKTAAAGDQRGGHREV
jgi:hypothetical protein